MARTSRRHLSRNAWLGLFSTPKKRRTSRKQRRTSRPKPKPAGLVVRKGYLSYGDLNARQYTGPQASFRGRIEVDRGSGMLEYPLPSQMGRIAREEGVDAKYIRQAFGHMRGLTRNAEARRAQRGQLWTADGWVAEEVPLDFDPAGLGLASDKRIGIWEGGSQSEGGALTGFMDIGEVYVKARSLGFVGGQIQRAFGHLKKGMGVGPKSEHRIPGHYGPRSMKLGTLNEEGKITGGVKKGALVLYYKPSAKAAATPVWRAYEIKGAKPTKTRKGVRLPPKNIAVHAGAGAKDMTWEKALTSAEEREIPPMAFLKAFGHLLSMPELKRYYAHFVPKPTVEVPLDEVDLD